MRPDMHKVITEKPRSGGGLKDPSGYKRQMSKIPLEDQPKRESMRKKWVAFWGGKEFTDVLGPLRRFLLSNVGRPWNKVYSEIVAHLPKTNKQYLHVYTHIFQYVDVSVEMRGKVAYVTGFSGWQPAWFLYVHPETGLLCDNSKYRQRYKFKSKSPEAKPSSNPNVVYLKVKDVWYEVETTKAALDRRYCRYAVDTYDVALKREINSTEMLNLYGRHVVAVKKRQLSSREIKKLGDLLAV